MKKISVDIKGVVIFAITAALAAAGLMLNKGAAKPEYISYTAFWENVRAGEVSGVTINDGPKMRFSLGGDEVYETDNPRAQNLKEELLLQGVSVSEGSYVSPASLAQSAAGVFFFALAFFVAYKILNKRGIGASMALPGGPSGDAGKYAARFSDVAGNSEAKDSVSDIIDFLKNPEKYSKYGARMPRGILFHGAPGTGKTLMAKAVAGEAGVPFFTASGSDFVQMYVGVGAGRVRELFRKARESGKAVIFIDEIDALGKKRCSQGNPGGNDERDQTLNALLTEMSGFKSGEGIVVIAATNRADTLDEALLRPGRFDRRVEIGLPDFAGRKEILALHAKGKPLAAGFDLAALARRTVGFSGAMLENLLNEAAINAAKSGGPEITERHLDTAYYTIIAGSEKKDKSGITSEERRITAFHEAGHALAARISNPLASIVKITIIPSSGGAGGFCVSVPKDRMYHTKKELRGNIMTALAGRAAEELVFGPDNVTTGAAGDIEKASAAARDYAAGYGMSDKIGLINAGIIENKALLSRECRRLTREIYAETKALLSSHAPALKEIAETLLERETLNETELDEIFAAHGITGARAAG